MPKYKLTYFDARAKAEVARLLFTAAGVDFEDVRLPGEEWPQLKTSTPFGQLPILEIEGIPKKFAQSLAINNYLAREFNLYGKDNLETFKIDEVVGLCEDFFLTFRLIVHHDESPKSKEELIKIAKEVDCPKFLGFFEKLLADNGTEYFVGDKLTMADLAVFSLVDHAVQWSPEILKGFPKVDANRKKLASNEKLAAYLKNRKDTHV